MKNTHSVGQSCVRGERKIDSTDASEEMQENHHLF